MEPVKAVGGFVIAVLLILMPIGTAAAKFGAIVGPVTEDVRKELNLRKADGVVVYEVIGDSLAERAGLKVKAVIAEINNVSVHDMDDFGRLLALGLKSGNITIGTWEPASHEDQGATAQMNFHFVPTRLD